jgi:hypothetical protein
MPPSKMASEPITKVTTEGSIGSAPLVTPTHPMCTINGGAVATRGAIGVARPLMTLALKVNPFFRLVSVKVVLMGKGCAGPRGSGAHQRPRGHLAADNIALAGMETPPACRRGSADGAPPTLVPPLPVLLWALAALRTTPSGHQPLGPNSWPGSELPLPWTSAAGRMEHEALQ